nr:HEAT repeat domain-containing protein [Kouleothrix sp.]
MTIAEHIYAIGARDHKLAMRELKPLSGLGFEARAEFWPAWMSVVARRRAEIAHAMVELAEDNVDLDFAQALLWMLDDDDAEVRASAAEGLWESERTQVLHRLLDLLRADPAPAV